MQSEALKSYESLDIDTMMMLLFITKEGIRVRSELENRIFLGLRAPMPII